MSLIPLRRENKEMDHNMNCISYAMGVDDSINELSSQGFEIVPDDEDYKVKFNSVNSDIWESYIREHIKDTYWNEYINLNTMDITFLIKENDEITRVVNHNFEENDELLQTCNRLCEQNFKTIKDLIYSCSFYKEAIENNPFKLKFDNPNIYMRPATEDDVDNMYAWEMESIDKSLQEDPKVQQLIRDDCYQSIKDTQMIMDQDKTIGMFTACMIDNGEWRYIGEIYLIPEYRGQHIGSTILKNEIANYDRIRLQVAYDNENALRLYKSLGFKIVKENKEAKLYIMEYDKSSTIQEAALKTKERNALKNGDFALVYKDKNGKLIRKYPVHDESHVVAASKMFPRGVPDEYKERVARRILREAKSYKLDTSGWKSIHKALEKNVSESYVERKNFIMKEQITKILEAYNSGVLTQEEASTKIEAIQEGAYLQKLKDMANNWDEDYFQAYSKVVDNAYKEVKYGPDGKPEDPAKYDDWIKKSQFLKNMKALRPKHFEFRNAKEHNDHYNKLAHGDSERAKEMINNTDASKNKYANSVTQAANNNESDTVLGIRESAIMNNLRVKQDKIMESFKMGIINATEGMRLIERVMMEADYIAEEEDTAYEGDDATDNTLDDAAPADDTADVDDAEVVDTADTDTAASAQIGALAEYINSLDEAEKSALLAQINTSAPEEAPVDEPTTEEEPVPESDEAPVTEEDASDTAPADVAGSDVGDAGADVSIDDMEV